MRLNRKIWVPVLAGLALVLVVGASPAEEKKEEEKKDKSVEKRAEIDAMATKALEQVLAKSPDAKALYGKSTGYAAFENIKIAVGVSGGGGSGVAVPKSGKRVYMKMGTAGIGFGLGGQKYQVVFFFENAGALNSFVEKGWQADASAQASASDKGANVGVAFKNGVAVFQMTEKGLMASADISGTKYWKNEDLNK
jgi:lipid-binding SYLF domain-containing protein